MCGRSAIEIETPPGGHNGGLAGVAAHGCEVAAPPGHVHVNDAANGTAAEADGAVLTADATGRHWTWADGRDGPDEVPT